MSPLFVPILIWLATSCSHAKTAETNRVAKYNVNEECGYRDGGKQDMAEILFSRPADFARGCSANTVVIKLFVRMIFLNTIGKHKLSEIMLPIITQSM